MKKATFVFRFKTNPADEKTNWTSLIQFQAINAEDATAQLERFIERKNNEGDNGTYWKSLYEFWVRDGKHIAEVTTRRVPVAAPKKVEDEVDENPYGIAQPEEKKTSKLRTKRPAVPKVEREPSESAKPTMKSINKALEAAGSANRVEGKNGTIWEIYADGSANQLSVSRWSDWSLEQWMEKCK